MGCAARCAACDVRRRVQHRSRILLRRAEQHLRVGEHQQPLLQRVSLSRGPSPAGLPERAVLRDVGVRVRRAPAGEGACSISTQQGRGSFTDGWKRCHHDARLLAERHELFAAAVSRGRGNRGRLAAARPAGARRAEDEPCGGAARGLEARPLRARARRQGRRRRPGGRLPRPVAGELSHLSAHLPASCLCP